MFGNATIRSKLQLEKIIRALEVNNLSAIARDEDREAIAIHSLTDSFKSKEADSFLFVRCVADSSNEQNMQEAVNYAKRRAYLVATALSLLWLAPCASNMGETCAL